MPLILIRHKLSSHQIFMGVLLPIFIVVPAARESLGCGDAITGNLPPGLEGDVL
jgi:hypothetical protein